MSIYAILRDMYVLYQTSIVLYIVYYKCLEHIICTICDLRCGLAQNLNGFNYPDILGLRCHIVQQKYRALHG